MAQISVLVLLLKGFRLGVWARVWRALWRDFDIFVCRVSTWALLEASENNLDLEDPGNLVA